MRVGTVREVWRYPIKSMRGERLDGARVGERGIEGDRAYAVRDQQTGKIASAKHPRLWGALLSCVARIIEPAGALSITLPGGRQITRGQDDVDAALSALTGRAVRLVDTVPERAEIERYWPDVDGLALRDTVTANEISGGSPAGTFFDYAPLHVLTTAALATLRDLHPAGQVDSRRFRPNLVIETLDGARGFVENEWVGRTLLIGSDVRVRLSDPTPRCVVPTLPQGELAGDIALLRAIARHNRPPVPALGGERLPCLGVYASVEVGGMLRVGDAVRLAEADYGVSGELASSQSTGDVRGKRESKSILVPAPGQRNQSHICCHQT